VSKPDGNPYPVNSAEYEMWEQWHRAFFAEPVHAQLYAIEADLRQAMAELMQTSNQVPTLNSAHDLGAMS